MRTRTSKRVLSRKKRHSRVRKNVLGTAERPRLSVFRGLRHIFAQLVDDTTGRTLISASSIAKEVRGSVAGKKKREVSKTVGLLLAQRAKAANIQAVTFDRGGYLCHGRVKALAEGAREGGLKF